MFAAKLNTGPIQRPYSAEALNIDWEKANTIEWESSVIPAA